MVNMRERYESIGLTDLREMAKNRKIKGAASMKKADLVEAMLIKDREDEREKAEEASPTMVTAKARRKVAIPNNQTTNLLNDRQE